MGLKILNNKAVVLAKVGFFCLFAYFNCPNQLIAEISVHDHGHKHEFQVVPTSLRDGSLITMISPQRWSGVGSELKETLVLTHRDLSTYFGKLSPLNTFVRIVPEKSFFDSTGAPNWTNALFYKGQIFIPMSDTKALDSENLKRSAKHEYVHAVFSSISAGRSPGWLDEGIAQWAEGDENPILRPVLLKYLKKNKPLPLSKLQGGFTKLPTDKVAPAYAQSLIIALMLKQSFGLKSIRTYLELLAGGQNSSSAFEQAFGISELHFEELIQSNLREWTLSL
jgi:hypothetical protein